MNLNCMTIYELRYPYKLLANSDILHNIISDFAAPDTRHSIYSKSNIVDIFDVICQVLPISIPYKID